MTSKLLIGCILFLTFVCACHGQYPVPDNRGYIVKVGDNIDDFEINLLESSAQKLSQFHSKVIVLNFFASW